MTAERYQDAESTEDVVRRLASHKREKLVQIGLSYDLAHAKGIVVETDKERKAREDREWRRKHAERKKLKEETKRRLQKEYIRERKMSARKQRIAERLSQSSLSKSRASTGSSGSSSTLVNGRNGTNGGEQILPDGPVQSPSDIANGTTTTNGHAHSNGFEAGEPSTSTSTITNKTSIPTIQLHGDPRPESYIARKRRRILHSSLDTSYSTHTSSYYDNSSNELLEGFEFDSELDMPPEEPEPKSSAASAQPGGGMCLDEANSDPWNAVCVVGLRVYSKDPELSLEVIRPVPEDGIEAALDMDDPAASATSPKFSIPRNLSLK